MLTLRRLRPDELPMADLSGRTIGALQLGLDTIYTIEKPWVPCDKPGGTPFISCVPVGVYDLVWRDSPAKGTRVHLVNEDLGIALHKKADVPRFSCMFHIANHARNVEGCIGPGEKIANFKEPNGWGVSGSGLALAKLEKYVKTYNVTKLEII